MQLQVTIRQDVAIDNIATVQMKIGATEIIYGQATSGHIIYQVAVGNQEITQHQQAKNMLFQCVV